MLSQPQRRSIWGGVLPTSPDASLWSGWQVGSYFRRSSWFDKLTMSVLLAPQVLSPSKDLQSIFVPTMMLVQRRISPRNIWDDSLAGTPEAEARPDCVWGC